MNIAGKRITVMGLGLFGGGLGIARYLVRHGARVTVTDLRTEDQLEESVRALKGLSVVLKLGGHDPADFTDADRIFVNPAVPKTSEYLALARNNGVPLDTEMNLFFRECPSPILGVTGSNGKTTTTALFGAMLRRADPSTLVGGNIGGSLLDELEALRSDVPVVLELSSFQLEDLRAIQRSPQISVVLNLTPNHLDRHGTMEAYAAAKRTILDYQTCDDLAVLNAEDPIVREWKAACKGRILFFGMERTSAGGAFVEKGLIVFEEGRRRVPLCRVDELRLLGNHNLRNALAATVAACAFGAPPEAIGGALRTFEGVEHRLELVREIDGVRYYNDSIATTPESTVAALRAFDAPVVLIAGGYDKGISFDELGGIIAERTRALILIGATAGRIASAVRPYVSDLSISECDTLPEAVRLAANLAHSGDVVLLSPACASYDMFRNFEDRGRQFKEIVGQINAAIHNRESRR